MHREPIAMFCVSDIAGQVRGKGFPARLLDRRLKEGVGWTPTNVMITALGPIADTPFGSLGDVTLLPDPAAKAEVEFGDGSPAERFFLCDVLESDGAPWSCCLRTFLKSVVARWRETAQLEPWVAFEHEFVYSGANERLGDAYSLDALRRHGAFGEVFLHALREAGIEADSYLPEYGPAQFEVTYPPSDPLTACDRAVILRELARGTALRLGHEVSFAPVVAMGGLGNGVHIHVSLRDASGRPVAYDAKGPHGLSEVAGRFAAGILRHMPALCAFTAPTPVSYLRLVPHRWSASYNNLGYRDREAGLRICPVFATRTASAAEQYNLEYRAADASASPYLQLAMILRAGLEGIERKLAMPQAAEGDADAMAPAERERRGIVRLPTSLGAALDALERDEVVQSWLPPALLDAYRRYKKSEIDLTRELAPEELCAKYRVVY